MSVNRTRLVAILLWLLVFVGVAFVGVQQRTRAAPVRIRAEVIEGEAGIAGCPLSALVAVAKVNANHYARFGETPTWYGWARPSHATSSTPAPSPGSSVMNMTTSKAHGGRREGAGRKPLPPDAKKVKRWVLLRPPLWEWLEEQRDGKQTVSQVVERIIEQAREGGKEAGR